MKSAALSAAFFVHSKPTTTSRSSVPVARSNGAEDVGRDPVLRHFDGHAVLERRVEVDHPRAIATEQCLGIVGREPVRREHQFVGDRVAPDAKHLAPPRGIADRAPALRQQHRARGLGERIDRFRRREHGLAFRVGRGHRIARRVNAHEPERAAAPVEPRQIAQDARGLVVVVREARAPVPHRRLLLVGSGRGFVVDGIEVVGIDRGCATGPAVGARECSGSRCASAAARSAMCPSKAPTSADGSRPRTRPLASSSIRFCSARRSTTSALRAACADATRAPSALRSVRRKRPRGPPRRGRSSPTRSGPPPRAAAATADRARFALA